ncbi:MAG: DegV family protein [Bacillota bacterium]|jgi:DegV family protein with EDD domain
MARVRIVTDSSQDFDPALLESQGISVIPLTVHFGDEEYLDGFQLRGGDFYRKLRTSPHHPRTSQPSPAAFQKVFQDLSEDGSEVIAITLSSNLSGTFQSATIARDTLPNSNKIHVIDSKQASGGHGYMVLLANEMAQSGCSSEEIIEKIQRAIDNMVTIFSVDTLDYLARNGRIGRAQHFLGSMLNLKPILGLDKEGYVTSVDRVRGKGRVIPRMIELVQERVPKGVLLDVVITHAEAPSEAAKLKEAMRSAFEVRRYEESEIGAIIGSHTGPGTLGLFVAPDVK